MGLLLAAVLMILIGLGMWAMDRWASDLPGPKNRMPFGDFPAGIGYFIAGGIFMAVFVIAVVIALASR